MLFTFVLLLLLLLFCLSCYSRVVLLLLFNLLCSSWLRLSLRRMRFNARWCVLIKNNLLNCCCQKSLKYSVSRESNKNLPSIERACLGVENIINVNYYETNRTPKHLLVPKFNENQPKIITNTFQSQPTDRSTI